MLKYWKKHARFIKIFFAMIKHKEQLMVKHFKGFYLILLLSIPLKITCECTIPSDESGSIFPEDVCQTLRDWKSDRNIRFLLLHGKTGRGKSELAKLMGKANNSRIIITQCPKLITEYSGSVQKGLDKIMQEAEDTFINPKFKDISTVVLIFDEAEVIGGCVNVNEHNTQHVDGAKATWTMFDNYKNDKRFIFILTTNGLSQLAPQIISRMDKAVELGYQPKEARKRNIIYFIKQSNTQVAVSEKQLNEIADLTNDVPFRTIEKSIKSALIQAKETGAFDIEYFKSELQKNNKALQDAENKDKKTQPEEKSLARKAGETAVTTVVSTTAATTTYAVIKKFNLDEKIATGMKIAYERIKDTLGF